VRSFQRLQISFISMIAVWFILPGIALGQNQIGRSTIAQPGTTVLAASSPIGKVNITIRTAKLDSKCADASPVGWLLKENGVKEITVVHDMRISINGKSIGVIPGAVYAFLINPQAASLQFENGSLILRIDGGDASLSYFENTYFDRKGVNRSMSYSSLIPDKPNTDTHFYRNDLPDQ
jgi:hypothetical protein